MNARKIFREFASYLQDTFPTYSVTKKFDDTEIPKFEEVFLPEIFKILKKDKSLFDEPRVVFDVNVSELFLLNETSQLPIWKFMQTCAIAAFLGENIKEKIGTILESLKLAIGESGQATDEIDKLIGNEESQSKIGEILEYIINSRLSSVVMNIIQSIDFSELDFDVESQEDVMEMAKNIQSNPAFEKIIKQLRDLLQDKIKAGQISQQEIVQEVETIKVKIQEAFGDMFEGALGGRKADVAPEVIMSNSPDARRARMIARMQRKVKEKRDGKNSS